MDGRAESGFGGWVDEKVETVREAAPLLSRKKVYPQHLTIALILGALPCAEGSSANSSKEASSKLA